VLADVLPILGDLIGIGTGIVAFLIATPVALITIGIAWLFYRPLLGIVLLAAAGGLLFLLIKKRMAAKAAKAAKEEEAPAAEAPAESAE
jgi:Flp pilus assembly protein TadB